MTSARLMRSLLLVLPLAGVLTLAWCEGRWLVSDIYAREVREAAQRGTALRSLVDPTRVASHLAPWNAALHTSLARILYSAGAPLTEVDDEYRAAIALAPADAYVWLDRAQMLAAQRHYGSDLELAVTRVQALGPSAPPVQRANAQLGLEHWFRGSLAVQQMWTRSMAYELRHEPRRFLRTAAAHGGRYWLCASAALDLPMEPWCRGLWQHDVPQPSGAGPHP